MDGWLPYALLNAACLAVFALAWLAAGRGPRWRLAVAGGVLALIIAKSALEWLPVWEAACFPFAWYVHLQSFALPLLMMAFFGVAAPQLTVPWNRVAVALIALALWVHLGLVGTWWLVDRPPLGAERLPDAAHHLRQSTPYTCAPCAAASALSYVGVPASERQLADRCLTVAEHGTTRFHTYRGLLISLAGTPWAARMAHASLDDLCRAGQVAVIDFPDQRHAIATVGTGTGVTLHDPLLAKPMPLGREELADHYGGVAILVERR